MPRAEKPVTYFRILLYILHDGEKLFIHSVLFEIILCAIKYYYNIVFTNDTAFIKIHITCIHIYISTVNKERIAMCFFFAQNLKRDGSCKYFLLIVHVTALRGLDRD